MQTTAFLPLAPTAVVRRCGSGGGSRAFCGRPLVLPTGGGGVAVGAAAGAASRRAAPLLPPRRRAGPPRVAMAAPPPDTEAAGDDGLDAAERTRRALSAEPPAVVFRNKYDPSSGRGGTDGGEGEGFAYEAGSTGVDVWLIAGILCFVVPVVVFAIGVQQNIIDLTPR